MFKVLLILLFGLVLEAMGVVLLSHGLHDIGEVNRLSMRELGRVAGRGVTNQYILLGVLCLVLFFGCLLYLLSQQDVSLIWPLTSLGFVLTVLAARFIRHEEVTPLRWGGVVLIVVGAALVAWSEQKKTATVRAESGASDYARDQVPREGLGAPGLAREPGAVEVTPGSVRPPARNAPRGHRNRPAMAKSIQHFHWG